MVRTQIQLTQEQVSALKAMSMTRGVSVAELIRLSIDSFVRRENRSSRELIVKRAMSAVGRFASGTTDASTEHDRYLAEAFEGR